MRGLVKGSGGGDDSFNAILIKTEDSTSCSTLTVREGWTVVHERYRSNHIGDIVCESWTANHTGHEGRTVVQDHCRSTYIVCESWTVRSNHTVRKSRTCVQKCCRTIYTVRERWTIFLERSRSIHLVREGWTVFQEHGRST